MCWNNTRFRRLAVLSKCFVRKQQHLVAIRVTRMTLEAHRALESLRKFDATVSSPLELDYPFPFYSYTWTGGYRWSDKLEGRSPAKLERPSSVVPIQTHTRQSRDQFLAQPELLYKSAQKKKRTSLAVKNLGVFLYFCDARVHAGNQRNKNECENGTSWTIEKRGVRVCEFI